MLRWHESLCSGVMKYLQWSGHHGMAASCLSLSPATFSHHYPNIIWLLTFTFMQCASIQRYTVYNMLYSWVVEISTKVCCCWNRNCTFWQIFQHVMKQTSKGCWPVSRPWMIFWSSKMSFERLHFQINMSCLSKLNCPVWLRNFPPI